MLLFKKMFYAAIADGRKTTTLRFWRRRQVKPGSLHNVRGLGRLQIESVEPISPADVTEAHARADGFESLHDLQVALRQMYGPDPSAAGRQLYLVRFIYLGANAQSS